MNADRLFLDTSFLIALENRIDVFHQAALRLELQIAAANTTLILHWGIVLELFDGYSKFGRRHKASDFLERFVEEEGYELIPLTHELFNAGLALYQSRQDKVWGLTDCISFALMEREGLHEALTADQHFTQAGFRALLLETT